MNASIPRWANEGPDLWDKPPEPHNIPGMNPQMPRYEPYGPVDFLESASMLQKRWKIISGQRRNFHNWKLHQMIVFGIENKFASDPLR
jgi:hypothetical protein